MGRATAVGTTGRRLSAAERERCVEMRVAGESVSAIARSLTCSRETVRHALASPQAKAFEQDCREILRERRREVLERWFESIEVAARQGKHRPALDWLLSARAIDPPVVAVVPTGPTMQVAIGIQLPGLPRPASPTIEMTALPGHIELAGSLSE